jgi:tartrate-resistant acid phosphatase type 5
MSMRLILCLMLLCAAPRQALAVVRFVALGDAGRGNAAQVENAKAIAAVCRDKGCDFALYLGDNFYEQGVASVDDPQFQTKFEQPYAGVDLPFYAVLGNHDYGDPPLQLWKPAFEIAYSARSPKWRMPHYYYQVSKENVDIFALDTQAVVAGIRERSNGEWLAGMLAASTADWKIVIGHHPYLSNGQHGNAGNYEGCAWFCPEIVSGTKLRRLVESAVCGQAAVYISGHDHNMQWLAPSCGTEFIVSGAGASTEGLVHRDATPTLFESDAAPGFLWIEIDGKRLTGAFYDKDGQLLFSRSLTR